jgi:aminopeptidase N
MKAINKLNENDNLSKYGLENFKGLTFKMSPDFEQILYLPADRNLQDPNSFIKENAFKDGKQVESLQKMLSRGKSEHGAITMKQSHFATHDISELAEALVKVIEEQYEVDLNYKH